MNTPNTKATQATNVARKTPRRFVSLSDELWDALKIHSIRNRMKVSKALEEAVQQYLKASKSTAKAA